MKKIAEQVNLEVIVIDNHSMENGFFDVLTQFPFIKLIKNESNLGFGKSNNIGVRHSLSDNILILNPDTIISEKVVLNALEALEKDVNVGAVGVKMLDGKGQYLPESRRGFPNIKASFLKLLGLNRWTSYYSSETSKNLDVLSGAFILMKKSVYEEIGGFDEQYFMYGEDIDISLQLNKAGYKAIYLEDLPIIHFKGKSSSKSNWKYQKTFYHAMRLYWNKNLASHREWGTGLMIGLGTKILTIISYIKHSLLLVIYPLVDFVFIWAASSGFSYLWSLIAMGNTEYLSWKYYFLILPIYVLTTIFSFVIHGVYDDYDNVFSIVKSWALQIVLALGLYFLLPTDFKFARTALLLFILASLTMPLICRWFFSLFWGKSLRWFLYKRLNFSGLERVNDREKLNYLVKQYSDFQIVDSLPSKHQQAIIDVDNATNEEIIKCIQSSDKWEVWLYSESGSYLIQSRGQDELEYMIAKDRNYDILKPSQRLSKRIFDIIFSLLAITLGVFSSLNYSKIVKDSVSVILNRKTWIATRDSIPLVSVFLVPHSLEEEYIRNYSVLRDMEYGLSNMFKSTN